MLSASGVSNSTRALHSGASHGGVTGRSSSPSAQRCATRPAAQNTKRRPYHAEIVALADTTAELPPPWRQQAIAIVHAIKNLFQHIWRELRRRLPPVATADAAAPDPAEAGDRATPD